MGLLILKIRRNYYTKLRKRKRRHQENKDYRTEISVADFFKKMRRRRSEWQEEGGGRCTLLDLLLLLQKTAKIGRQIHPQFRDAHGRLQWAFITKQVGLYSPWSPPLYWAPLYLVRVSGVIWENFKEASKKKKPPIKKSHEMMAFKFYLFFFQLC